MAENEPTSEHDQRNQVAGFHFSQDPYALNSGGTPKPPSDAEIAAQLGEETAPTLQDVCQLFINAQAALVAAINDSWTDELRSRHRGKLFEYMANTDRLIEELRPY